MKRITCSRMETLMERIREVRYSDLEMEKELCLELLELAKDEDDSYGTAFGNVYLGDYYVAKNDGHGCAPILLKGLSISLEYNYEDLQVMSYCLLGVYFEMIGDEHTAVEYYMNGVQIARKCKDLYSECKCYTNISSDFQQYGNYQEARRYSRKALNLFREMEAMGELSREAVYLKVVIVSNLVEQSIMTKDLEQGRRYCEDCGNINFKESDESMRNVFAWRNWCHYHTAVNEREQALAYAGKLLSYEAFLCENKFVGFEISSMACNDMLTLGHKENALSFFWMMCKASGEDGGELKFRILDMNMKLLLRFGTSEDVELAYKEYYENHVELEQNRDNIRVEAMMSNICLHQVVEEQAGMKEKKQSLETAAHMDVLTQLYNRRYFNTLISQSFTNAGIKRIGAVMLDVDNFKEYNDFYGHVKGDQVLIAIASCMQENSDRRICVCRFGGDEFLCLCIDLENEDIEEFISKVQDGVDTLNITHAMSSCSDRVTLSIGYANEDKDHGIQAYEIFEMADRALYKSKLKGKNMFTREQYEWDDMA